MQIFIQRTQFTRVRISNALLIANYCFKNTIYKCSNFKCKLQILIAIRIIVANCKFKGKLHVLIANSNSYAIANLNSKFEFYFYSNFILFEFQLHNFKVRNKKYFILKVKFTVLSFYKWISHVFQFRDISC